MIMKKRLSDLRLQDEIKLFTALIMILVVIFQLIIYTYYYISLKSQKDYIYESINVMMNETIANQLSKLDKYQNLMTQQKSLRLFLNNTSNSEQQFELENTIYTLQQISDSTLYGVVFDENGHLHKLSQNISDSKINEIEKMYKEYINSPNKNRYYFFVIPDSSYREIYFLCFCDVNESVYETASIRYLGTTCIFLQISTDTLLDDYSIAKNAKFYLDDGKRTMLMFDRGNTSDTVLEIKDIKIRNTNWNMHGIVNYSSLFPNINHVLILIFLETFLAYLAIWLLNKCIRHRMINPFNETKRYIEQLSISQLFKPLEVKGNKDINEFASNINNMVIRNKKLANSVLMKQQRLYEAEHLRDTATLYALQNQVNPHFMYNIFELIRSIAVVEDNRRIETIVTCVSKLLRYNLKNDTIVTLKDEFEITKLYINIMKIKYGDSFDVEFNIPDDLLEVSVMKMLFQPVLENSFNHGFIRKQDKFKIVISVSQTDDYIQFIFRDNGLGIEKKKLDEIRSNLGQRLANCEKLIGISNLNQRLNMCYGMDKYSFSIDSELNKYTETIKKIIK